MNLDKVARIIKKKWTFLDHICSKSPFRAYFKWNCQEPDGDVFPKRRIVQGPADLRIAHSSRSPFQCDFDGLYCAEHGAWLSPVRALGSGPRGRGFESHRPDISNSGCTSRLKFTLHQSGIKLCENRRTVSRFSCGRSQLMEKQTKQWLICLQNF